MRDNHQYEKTNGICLFSDWLGSLNMVISSCIYFPANGMTLLSFYGRGKQVTVYVNHIPLSILLYLDTWVIAIVSSCD